MSKNIKLYNCDTCDYSSTRKANLERHAKTHDKPKKLPLKCPDCKYTSMVKCNYQKHLETHKNDVYRCTVCNIRVKDPKTHKKTLHHHFTYEGIKYAFRRENYWGRIDFITKTKEEQNRIVNSAFNYEKYRGKPVFVKEDRKKIQIGDMEEIPIEDRITDKEWAAEIFETKEEIEAIISPDEEEEYAAILTMPDGRRKFDLLDELLMKLQDRDQRDALS
jgi:hypothetical protein